MKSKAYPSFWKRFQLSIHRNYVKSETKLHDLRYLFWECTLRCNLNCIHCGSDCHKESHVPDMVLDDFLNVTNQIKKYCNPNKTTVILTGGEPLLRKDLEECGKALNRQGYPWGIVSNGLLLDATRVKKLINSGLSSVTISLDGLKEDHNWFRGHRNSFDNALNAISILSAYQDKIAFDVVSCINQQNIKDLEDIKELLIKTGVKRWRIFTVFPIGRALNNNLLHLEPDQFTLLMRFISTTRKEGRISLKYGCEAFLGNYENEVRDGFYFCRAGINIASVLADGSIGACPNIDHTYIQGNIYKESFIDVWNSKYKVYRDKKTYLPEQCKNCKVKRWCMGSSMHLRDASNKLLKCHYDLLK